MINIKEGFVVQLIIKSCITRDVATLAWTHVAIATSTSRIGEQMSQYINITRIRAHYAHFDRDCSAQVLSCLINQIRDVKSKKIIDSQHVEVNHAGNLGLNFDYLLSTSTALRM